MPRIISLGECMVELSAAEPPATARLFQKSCGGDTLNVLVAAARLGSSTGYITRLGDDPFAPYLLQAWQEEGLDVSQVKLVPGFNGLYLIARAQGGQHEFLYYRSGSAASTLEPADLDPQYIAAARFLHLSGITQAISPSARATTLEAARLAHRHGVLVSYDPNLRPRLWSVAQARAALEEILPYVTVFLPSAPEELSLLLDVAEPAEAIPLFRERGVKIVAVKRGAAGCLVWAGGETVAIPAYAPGESVDTTGAGDAFDGAFLHGLEAGLPPLAAARLGVITAGLKTQARGAILGLPRRQQVYQVFHSQIAG